MIAVRAAVAADAAAMSAVLISSITELCTADHRNDPDALASWLANKTPEGVAAWFGNPDSVLLVAERSGEIAAIGGYFVSGRAVSLNYVSPRHRFAGVSAAMLTAIESRLGSGAARLDSTQTARRFYESRGWTRAGEPASYRGILAYPMRKVLV